MHTSKSIEGVRANLKTFAAMKACVRKVQMHSSRALGTKDGVDLVEVFRCVLAKVILLEQCLLS